MMQSLGDKLRAAREAKGLSASEAAKETKIKVQHIEALESEDYDKMAAPIYVKGFIRMYAEYLDLDAGELLEQYKSANAPLTPEQIVGNQAAKPKSPSKIFNRRAKVEEAPSEMSENAEKTSGVALDWSGMMERLKAVLGAIKLPHANWKQILTVFGALLVLILIISSVKNCAQRAGSKREKDELDQIEFIEDVPEPYLNPEYIPKN